MDYRVYMGSSMTVRSLRWLSLYLCTYKLVGSMTGHCCCNQPTMIFLSKRHWPQAPKPSRKGSVTSRLSEAGPAYIWQLLYDINYPHRPTHVFSAHFVLTRAHPGRTSWSVTHRSRPSTLNLGVICRWASGKEVATYWYEYPINPVKPWAGMLHRSLPVSLHS